MTIAIAMVMMLAMVIMMEVADVLVLGGVCWVFSLCVTDEGHVVVAESWSESSVSVGIFVGL